MTREGRNLQEPTIVRPGFRALSVVWVAFSQNISELGLNSANIKFHLESLPFEQAFAQSKAILNDRQTAKLVLIDQFGVSHVTRSVFEQLIGFPTCDFLFFISSSTLHRFRDVPVIQQKIGKVEDPHHVHRVVLAHYRELIPENIEYHLAPFSIRKGSNIYGLIFGSAHPLGIDKFLEVAWEKDKLNGEANFDVNRDKIDPDALFLPLEEFKPTKLTRFARELEGRITKGLVQDERGVIMVCHEHGVRRKHAEPVLKKLKENRVIKSDFQVPQIKRLKNPRGIFPL